MALVLDVLGVVRDQGSLSPASPVQYRDRFFQSVFERIERSAGHGGPLVGSNFWAWGGFGSAQHADGAWRAGDRSYVGDPPQEAQGLNSVFASDASTLQVLRAHSKNLAVVELDTDDID
jgi:mannan endo-1,4-beta-mannosidase